MSTTTPNHDVEDAHSQSPGDTPSGSSGTEQGFGRETRTTMGYALAGIACLAVTGAVELANRPAEIEEFGKVGQEFFPDFGDPTLATALNVSMIDPDQVAAREFSVERQQNDQWVIPSHHNYPADAEDQLAETASSIIGIRRGAMVTRWPADHARFGVVNPKVDSIGVDQVQGIGKRLTLRGEGDAVLADYIIGEQVDGEADQYYVRHPDEDEVYVATLNIDLSTKFKDWIDTDLLNINGSDLVNVALNDYQFDELNSTVTKSDLTTLSRESSTEDWKMDGLDEETSEVDEDAIRDTVNAIADLAITGVRPKQKGLTPELQLDRASLGSQRDLDRLQQDLISRGFLLQPDREAGPDSLKLIAREGELSAAANDGLVYKLYFGRVFTGSQEELEIGLGSGKDDEASKSDDGSSSEKSGDDGGDESSEEGADENASKDDDTADGEEESSDSSDAKPGRYVFVTVTFDKQFLGEELIKPVEPEKPEELTKLEEAAKQADKDASESGEDDSEEKQASDSDNDSEDGDSDDSDAEDSESASEDGEEKESDEDRLETLQMEYRAALEEYAADVEAYDAFQEEITKGKEKAEKLNRRFAQWYYVIEGESYDKLSLSRDDLIKAKEEEEAEGEADPDAGPKTDIPMPDLNAPAVSAPAVSEPKAADSETAPSESDNADAKEDDAAEKSDDSPAESEESSDSKESLESKENSEPDEPAEKDDGEESDDPPKQDESDTDPSEESPASEEDSAEPESSESDAKADEPAKAEE